MIRTIAAILASLWLTAAAQACNFPGTGDCVQLNNGTAASTLPANTTAFTNPNPFDSSTQVATDAFALSQMKVTMSTVPMTITGGTYSFASNASVFPALNCTAVANAFTSCTVSNGGAGLAVGDLVTPNSGNHDALVQVATISGGVAQTVNMVYGGTGQATAAGIATGAPNTLAYTYVLSGTLASNATIIVPVGTLLTTSNQWNFANNTTGAFTVTVCISSGADVCSAGRSAFIPQGSNNNHTIGVLTDGVLNVDLVTVANAADLTGTALPSGLTAPNLTVTGTFIASSASGSFAGLSILSGQAGTETADGSNSLTQQTSKTAYSIYSPLLPANWFFYGVNRAVVDLESGITVQQASAFDGYVYNNVAQGSSPNSKNGVGIYLLQVDAVNGAASWGVNTACNDNNVNGLAALSGRKCVGYEADFQANGASTFQGAAFIMQGAGTPANANGVSISISSGSIAVWTNGYITGDGAVSGDAATFGALATSGSNIASQPICLNAFNSSAAEAAQCLQAIPFGTAYGFQFTTNTLANGVVLVMAATGGSPQIIAAGGDTNMNLALAAKGTGALTTVNKIVAGSGSLSGVGLSIQNTVGTCTFTATSSGAATQSCSSDARLKTDIHNAASKLDWLDSFGVRDYTIRASGEAGTSPIAQEVQSVHPEMVTEAADGMLLLQAPSPWKMIKAMQELKERNDYLEARISALEHFVMETRH